MGRFAGEPDYALTWPPESFAVELQRLVRRAKRYGMGSEWYVEVETLLGQAFSSPVPFGDFKHALEAKTVTETFYEDEPF